MALIKESKPKQSTGGYWRLFGIKELADLITKVQSAVIRSGHELEKIIINSIERIGDLDEFLKQDTMQNGIFLADKKQIKKCNAFDTTGLEPDFLIFKREGGKQTCYIIELKDGHLFDTKKATQEEKCLYDFTSKNGPKFSFTFKYYICCFNSIIKKEIYNGLKRKIKEDNILTGKDFCNLFRLNYEEIQDERKKGCEENINFFLTELLKIKRVKQRIENLIS